MAATFGAFGQPEAHAADLRAVATVSRRTRTRLIVFASVCAAVISFNILSFAMGVPLGAALVTALFAPIVSLGFFWKVDLIAMGNVLGPAVENSLAAIFRLAAIAILFLLGALSLNSALAGTQIAAAGGALILLVMYMVTKRRALSSPVSSADRAVVDFKRAIIQALPTIGFATSTAITLRLDVIVLGILANPEQAGYYAAVVGFSESALALSAAFKNRMQAACYRPDAFRRVRREMFVMLAIALPGMAVGELVAPWLVTSLLGPEFEPAVAIFRVMILAAIFQLLLDCGQGLLVVLGLRRHLLVVSVAGALVTLVSLTLLVPSAGGVGAAWASVIGYGTVGAASLAIAYKALRPVVQ